jgi:hypothetical protein
MTYLTIIYLLTYLGPTYNKNIIVDNRSKTNV